MSFSSFIRGLEKEQQKEIVKVSATPAKKQMVATKQKSVQAEKEDTTQLINRDEHNCKRVGWVASWWIG
jgi:hypothetical protein